MAVVILWDENRKYPRWLLRVHVCGNWYDVTNLADPRFWQDWWSGFYGPRGWFLRRSIRHMVRRVPANWWVARGVNALY